MTRKIAMMAAAAFLTVIAGAALAEDDAALRAAAERHIRHPVTQSVMDSVLSLDTTRSHLVAQLRAQGMTLQDDHIEALSQIVQQELDRIRPQMETLMTDAAIETYSLEEMQALNAFYDTEFGASAAAKTGSFMQSFNAGAAPVFRQMLKRVADRIAAELPE